MFLFETLLFIYQTARRPISEKRNFFTLKYCIFFWGGEIIITASLIHKQVPLSTEYRILFLFG